MFWTTKNPKKILAIKMLVFFEGSNCMKKINIESSYATVI